MVRNHLNKFISNCELRLFVTSYHKTDFICILSNRRGVCFNFFLSFRKICLHTAYSRCNPRNILFDIRKICSDRFFIFKILSITNLSFDLSGQSICNILNLLCVVISNSRLFYSPPLISFTIINISDINTTLFIWFYDLESKFVFGNGGVINHVSKNCIIWNTCLGNTIFIK